MSTEPLSQQKDMFQPRMEGLPTQLVLYLKRIPAPRNVKMEAGRDNLPVKENFHIPSFKNAKRWITKLPNGKPLKRPLMITSPEFQDWMETAGRSLELQLLSMCQTGSDGIQQVRSKQFAMLSLLPVDDSVNDLPQGGWKVERVPPGEEGAKIVIERLR